MSFTPPEQHARPANFPQPSASLGTWAAIVACVALAAFSTGLVDSPFADEYAYITQSYYADLFFTGRHRRPRLATLLRLRPAAAPQVLDWPEPACRRPADAPHPRRGPLVRQLCLVRRWAYTLRRAAADHRDRSPRLRGDPRLRHNPRRTRRRHPRRIPPDRQPALSPARAPRHVRRPHRVPVPVSLALALFAATRAWTGRGTWTSLLAFTLSGLAAGLSVLCKFNGLLAPMIVGAWWPWPSSDRESPRGPAWSSPSAPC